MISGENPEGEANSGSCQGGPFSALTRSMWPSKGKYFMLILNQDCLGQEWTKYVRFLMCIFPDYVLLCVGIWYTFSSREVTVP